MGSKKGDPLAYEDELPQHEEKSITQRYLISRYPVTNAQFQAFVDDLEGYRHDRWWTQAGLQWRGERTGPKKAGGVFDLPNHPVVIVTWYEAVAFCHWLNEKFHVPGSALSGSATKGSKFQVWHDRSVETINLETWNLKHGTWHIRLPTEAEWEKAASWAEEQGSKGAGGKKRIWPWGDDFDPEKCNSVEAGIGSTCAVGLFPKGDSPYGCADMAGNVWEWCQSKWVGNYQHYDQGVQEREALEGNDPRVVRGGSFYYSRRFVRCASRSRFSPVNFSRYTGFRLVVSPSS